MGSFRWYRRPHDDGTYRILLERNGGKCGWVYKEYPSEEEAIIGMENLKKQIEQEKETNEKI